MVTGGWKAGSMLSNGLNSCELYNIDQNSWKNITPMNKARRSHAAIEVKLGTIYVFCGNKGKAYSGKYHDSIEYYTQKSDTWMDIQHDQKLSPREGLGVVSIKGGEEVIILGGYAGKVPLKDVFVLKTSSNSIELLKHDIGIKFKPQYYPVTEDQENQRIVFADYDKHLVFSMQLPSCEVEQIADIKNYFENNSMLEFEKSS